MKTIRAIFVGDVRFEQCPVFEFHEKTGYFEMLIDNEIKYSKEFIEGDDDFLVFAIEDDVVTLTNQVK